MRWTRDQLGEYRSEDGRYLIGRSLSWTDCEAPHPVRLPRRADPENYRGDWAAYFAAGDGRRGYWCEGGAEHPYETWDLYELEGGREVDTGHSFTTLREAKTAADGVDRQPRKRRPRPQPRPAATPPDYPTPALARQTPIQWRHVPSDHRVLELRRQDGVLQLRQVGPAQPYDLALALWDKLDRARTEPMYRHAYMVRRVDDPQWDFVEAA